MKKLFATTLITGAAVASALAQNVNLAASSSHGLIQYATGSLQGSIQGSAQTITPFPVGNPATLAPYGQLNIAVYSAAAGTKTPFTADTPSLLPVAWQESTTVLHQISPFAGFTLPSTFALPNITGSANAQVMVLAWTGSFTDWNSALAAETGLLGWTGSTLSGGALSWVNPTAAIPTAPASLTYGSAGFNGLVLTLIPEPGSFAIFGLGAAALMVFHRRRR